MTESAGTRPGAIDVRELATCLEARAADLPEKARRRIGLLIQSLLASEHEYTPVALHRMQTFVGLRLQYLRKMDLGFGVDIVKGMNYITVYQHDNQKFQRYNPENLSVLEKEKGPVDS